MGDVHDALAAAIPDRECAGLPRPPFHVGRDRRAHAPSRQPSARRRTGLPHRAGRSAPWESGQDHLGIYCLNGVEYLESILGAFKARVAPFNVNYRYGPTSCAGSWPTPPRAIVYHSAFAPVVAQIRDELPRAPRAAPGARRLRSGLLPGAAWYEDALAAAPATPPPVTPSPDDLYILYTGGTTGRPKGVLWRQADAFIECFGGSRTAESPADARSPRPRRSSAR